MSTINTPSDALNKQQPSALAINLGTNVALSLVTLAAFCWLRPKNGVIYARKYKSLPQDKRPPKLEDGYFSWMRPVWSCPDEVLVEKIGLDAVVFIRFVRMCRHIFLIMAVVGCGVLIPINVIATIRAQTNGAMPADKIAMLTMAGITDFKWFWAHVACVWFFSLVMFFAMYHGYKSFLKFRIRYFESEAYQEDMASRTIMLAGLPSSLQTDEKLFKFMSDMGLADKPVQALVGRKVDKLPELMDKHKKMIKALEKVVAKYYADPNRLPSKRPTVSVGRFCGTRVDAIDYYSQQIEELSDQIERTRNLVSKSQPTNYGFVSYATIHATHRVAKELSSAITLRKRSKMIDPPELFLSPTPKDIIWFNAANPKQLRKSRRIIVNIAFVVFSLLFFIPMGALTTITNLDHIVGLVPSSKEYFENHAFVSGMLQSLLPVLCMDILLLIVRKLIAYLAWFQGNITKSSTDRSTLAKFYLFFTVNNLIVFALTGTIIGFFSQIKLILSTFSFSAATWTAIKDFIRTQDNIVELLSQNVIDTSLFWVNYISLRNFGALLDLFQLVSLVLYWFKTTVTPRESKEMNKPDVFDFPLFFSVHMFLLTVALLYSVVAPLVLFFAAVYFSLASLTYKYQLMYVFRTKIETGGRLFRVVYNRLLAALVLFQVIMIGILNLKSAHTHSLAILPLPILTILFKLFLARTYDPKIDFYDYGSARDERHLFKGKGGKNALIMSFENPALNSKVVSALVPDAAKKMLSSKILHPDHGSKDGKSKRPGHGKQASRGKTSFHAQRDDNGQDHREESYEMGHVSRSPKAKDGFQVLGSDPYDQNTGYDSHSRAQSPQAQDRYQSQHSLGADDVVDVYYDNQKESLTKSATQRYDDTYSAHSNTSPKQSPEKVYGAQDMTAFVAGRYRADRPADPYSYSNNRGGNSNTDGGATTGSKPSYLELAKMHQTDSYKSTGKATQYEDKRALHLPPIKLPKVQASSGRRRNMDQQEQEQHSQDPFHSAQDDQGQDYDREYSSPPTPATPTTPQPSRMPLPQHQQPRRVQQSSSSHSLVSGKHENEYSSSGNDVSRAQTQANTKYYDDQPKTGRSRYNNNSSNEFSGNRYNNTQNQDTYV
ncbi:hypothetical protein EDD21DRAFT_400195 [Dissophora ornata]|nr:hypothetical protein BGZ58_008137 [Dissophora ornata]KAI8606736.1 hypothetical protein EDD21DRAFT_400195 [Dissophora ornata]